MAKYRKDIDKEKFKKAFQKLILHVKPWEEARKDIEKGAHPPGNIVAQDGFVFILHQNGILYHNKIVEDFFKVPFYKKHFTENQLISELNRLIANYFMESTNDKRKNLINSFSSELKDKTTKWLYVFPIEGITLGDARSLKLGKCILRKLSGYQEKQLSFNGDKLKIIAKKGSVNKLVSTNNMHVSEVE